MSDSNLNLKIESQATATPPSNVPKMEVLSAVFKFDPIPLLIYLVSKWKLIMVCFFTCLIVVWGFLKYKSSYSNDSWTAVALIFHQTKSDRIPSFYKPMETATVAQFIGSRDAITRVDEKMIGKPKYSRDMLQNVSVAIDKSRRSNIISVTASASTPELASDIANMVATEGINEYKSRQNDTVAMLLDDRKNAKDSIEKELKALQLDKEKFNSSESGFSPDTEIESRRTEITTLLQERNAQEIKLKSLQIQIQENEHLLKNTPRDVVFETIVDTNSSVNVEGKMAELERMRQRYTDDNPKIRVLVDEIKVLQKIQSDKDDQMNSRTTYRKNEIYSQLEHSLATSTLEEKSLSRSIELYDEAVKKLRAQIIELTDSNRQYTELTRQESVLQDKSAKLSSSISDIEYTMSSTVPDVYLFEQAKKPSSSNIQKAKIKVLAFSFVITFFFIVAMAVVKISKRKLMSSKEYAISLDIEDLGEIPHDPRLSIEERMSAIQRVAVNIGTHSNKEKKLAFLKFYSDKDMDEDIDELLNVNAISGLKTFRLKCMPIALKPETDINNADPDDMLASMLISVQKFADTGTFYYQNNLCLDIAEKDLLLFDLNLLENDYDLITIEAKCDETSAYLSSQLASVSNYAIIASSFDEENKMSLLKNVKQMKDSSEVKIGGILVNVPKQYYNGVL